MNVLAPIIAERTAIRLEQVDATLDLLDAGCTIPFISRYRKEATGNLNEVQVAAINDLYEKLKELQRRKETMIKTIEAQDKLTDDLRKRIDDCWNATELEDIYMPFKPRRRTRAQVAREQDWSRWPPSSVCNASLIRSRQPGASSKATWPMPQLPSRALKTSLPKT